MIDGKIPLFREVTNFSCKLSITQNGVCCHRDQPMEATVSRASFAVGSRSLANSAECGGINSGVIGFGALRGRFPAKAALIKIGRLA